MKSTPSQATHYDSDRRSVEARLTSTERGTLFAVLSVFVIRMLGLFMLLPVLSLYAADLPGATPVLIGLAVGAYGISQAALQIPFGWASDRYGRRPLLVVGLLIFAAGALVAAVSTTITGVIVGRVLQGAGAISAVLTAVIGDQIAVNKRTRAMAIVGGGIGLSFMLSLLLGPLLGGWLGVNGLFFVSAGLAVVALFVTLFKVPSQALPTDLEANAGNHIAPRSVTASGDWSSSLKNAALWQLNGGIFVLHFILAALFVALPFILRDQFGLIEGAQWKALGMIILLSIPGTVAFVLRSERNADAATATHAATPAIALIAITMLALAFGLGTTTLSLTLTVLLCAAFFSGFNFMEASLPARVSVVAGDKQRGAALGVYASFQFLGVFAGGAVAGWAMGVGGHSAAFLVSSMAAVVWFAAQLATLPKKTVI